MTAPPGQGRALIRVCRRPSGSRAAAARPVRSARGRFLHGGAAFRQSGVDSAGQITATPAQAFPSGDLGLVDRDAFKVLARGAVGSVCFAWPMMVLTVAKGMLDNTPIRTSAAP